MNLKQCKKIRKFIKSSAAELPIVSYNVGRNNIHQTIDEKGGIFRWEYTGTIRVDVRSQRGQYKIMKKMWKQDMRGF